MESMTAMKATKQSELAALQAKKLAQQAEVKQLAVSQGEQEVMAKVLQFRVAKATDAFAKQQELEKAELKKQQAAEEEAKNKTETASGSDSE